MSRRIVSRLLVVTAALVAATLPAASPATAAGAWVEVGSDRARPYDEGQGLATIERNGGTEIRYTGFSTIPWDVANRGWNHVGDPDSVGGYYIEPYQRDDNTAKMFRVQAPDGSWAEYVHAVPGWEMGNNSYTAIAPSGSWMLAGEWGTLDRILGFPTPGINPIASPSKDLPYWFAVRLDRPVRDVQGCDFYTPTVLLCSSDDPAGELYGITKPLLRIDLERPLDGGDVAGRVTALRQLPLSSGCSGNFEAEGIDVHPDRTLRVIVLSPGWCLMWDSKTWRLRES
ncbi:MAG: hypothetical protein ACRDT6_11210 [Micromonosporaceae bacterium]